MIFWLAGMLRSSGCYWRCVACNSSCMCLKMLVLRFAYRYIGILALVGAHGQQRFSVFNYAWTAGPFHHPCSGDTLILHGPATSPESYVSDLSSWSLKRVPFSQSRSDSKESLGHALEEGRKPKDEGRHQWSRRLVK